MCVEEELLKKKDIHKYTWTRIAGGIVDRELMDYEW